MATSEATHRAIDAVWRIEAAKVIAGVARMVRDVGLAEELAQDALVAALEHWPDDGVPDNPGAWLMRTAKNRALDRLRQEALHARKHEELGADMEALQAHVEPDFVDALAEASADDIGDDLLRLVFTACHPLLPTEGRVALTAAPARRPGHRRDRPRLPRAGGDDRAAHRPRQAHACRGQGAVRGARSERAGAAAGIGARGRLPDLQRRLFGHRRRRLDASRPLRRGAAPRPGARRPGAGGKRGPRPGRADGAAGLARPCPRRRAGPAGAAAGAGPLALGSLADPPRPGRARRAAGRSAAVAVPTHCRPRSPPVMPRPAAPRRPTGRGSPPSTSSWPRSRRRRWSS